MIKVYFQLQSGNTVTWEPLPINPSEKLSIEEVVDSLNKIFDSRCSTNEFFKLHNEAPGATLKFIRKSSIQAITIEQL